MGQDIKAKLKAVLAGREQVDFGQFRLLNLAQVRSAAGADWPRIKTRVFTAGQQLIETSLGPDDVVLPCGDGFLVILANPDADQTARLEAIGEKLRNFFLGEPQTEPLAVQTARGRASATEIEQLAEPEPAPDRAATGDEAAPERLALRPVPPAKTSADEDGDCLPFFRPIWNADTQSISGNGARTRIRVGGRMLDGRRAVEARMVPACHADLDHMAQKAALDALMRFVRAGAETELFVTLHADTWSDRSERTTYLDRFNRLPKAVRRAFIAGVDGLDDRPDRAIEPLKALAETGVRLKAQLDFGATDLSPFDGLDIAVFGFRSRPPANANSEGLLQHETRVLNATVKAAAERGADVALTDVRDLRMLKDAMACGVKLFSGQAVVADRQKPAPPQPLSIVDIYRMNKSA